MTRHYLTTPLYYVNAKPHIGHAYATILVDSLARYYRFYGDEVYFLTGTDEHGQKVMKAAENRGLSTVQHVDEMSEAFRGLWPTLQIEYDDFIRTTEDRHITVVQNFLQRLWEQGEIYEDDYEGWYSPSAERFWAEDELVDGKCPDTGLEVHYLKERNYFFRMGQYGEALKRHIESHPDFILPESRRNEILGFLAKPLGDLCISRPKERLSWGIPLPFAEDYVCYVWFDALTNYVSALGGKDSEAYKTWWPHATHFIGKDILTTHAVYWSCMLMALGIPLPQHIIATGWWLSEERKMSKSLGNVVDPLSMKDKYGSDVFRYFVLREMVIGLDSNFSEKALLRRNNSDLANDLGNLARRIKTLAIKHFDAKVPAANQLAERELAIVEAAKALPEKAKTLIDDLALHSAIEEIFQFIRSLNKYITDSAPFKTVKSNPDEAATSIYVVLEGIRFAANLLHPVMPAKMEELLETIGETPVSGASLLNWGDLKVGTPIVLGEGLFPKYDFPEEQEAEVEKVTAPKAKAKGNAPKGKSAEGGSDGVIAFEDFMATELVVGTIREAKKVEGSERLLCLQVDLGTESRQIVSGIALHFQVEELVGEQCLLVKNLAPRRIFKLESQGMILAAEGEDGKLALLKPGIAVPPGTRVS